MPKLTINGQTYDAEKGKTIIQVADDVGIEIPRYCYHPDIGIEGSCRMCLAEVKGAPKLVPSCATPIADHMEIPTDPDSVYQEVRDATECILHHSKTEYPVSDPTREGW